MGFGMYDDGIDRSGFAEKSGAAQRREDEAKAAFDKYRASTEAGSPPKAKVTVELLKPSTHLTQPCWSAFNKHVKKNAGWSAKRRVATEEEKRASGEKRQAKCYFVDVTFCPKAKAAAIKKAEKAAGPPAAKKQKVMGESTNSQKQPTLDFKPKASGTAADAPPAAALA